MNVAHLELVDHRTNTLRSTGPTALNARKTACIHGHPFTPENTRVRTDGSRRCITCERVRPTTERQAA